MSPTHFLVARRFCKMPHPWSTMASSTRCLPGGTNVYSSHKTTPTITSGCRYMSKQTGDANDGEGDFRPSDELLRERYDLRSNEELDKKRARLIYQSRKRGMLENGVILASFADKYLYKFDADQLDQYDRLINLPTNDWDIFYWATKTKPTPSEYETPVMAKLREHLKSKVSKSSLGSVHDKHYSNEAKQNKSSEQDFIGDISDKNKNDNITAPKYNILGKTDPEAIVARPRRKAINAFNFKASNISLLDYKEELYDEGIMRLPGGHYIQRMTDWRKHEIEKKLKRSLPAPISARNMNPDKKDMTIYTQRVEPRSVSYRGRVPRVPLVDSKRDRLLKHHNFMQHLLSSGFTNDAIDYDEEAEAWADMIWHRNYGQLDDQIAPSQLKCDSCAARLQCCDTGLAGYVPKELLSKFIYYSEQEQQQQGKMSHETNNNNDEITDKSPDQLCQRCSFSSTYDVSITSEIHQDFYVDYLQSLRSRSSSIVCIVVDLTDLPGSIWPGLLDHIGDHHKIFVVGNKLDLLPYDGGKMLNRVTYSLRKTLRRLKTVDRNLNLKDIVVLSARTGFGVESLVARLMEQLEVPRDIHIIGCNNSGKFTLFNALMQSDISSARQGDLLSRISTFECPGTQMNMLRFPSLSPESWEIAVKNRKAEIVERDHLRREHALGSVSEHRQQTMPHISLLINRLDFEPVYEEISPYDNKTPLEPRADTYNGNSLMKVTNSNEAVRFTKDHPLANVKYSDPFKADETNYPQHSFVYHGPSCTNQDQIHTLLTNEERLEVFPNETIVPRKYSLRPLHSIMIAGLGRLDLLTSNSSVVFNVFCSKYLPIHVISTSKADKFYTNFLGSPYLGIPFGDANRMATWPGLKRSEVDFNIIGNGHTLGSADVVLSSVGWVLVNLEQDHECIVRAHTPGGKGIFLRDPPLLAFANRSLGKKIRDTPLFKHPHYTIAETSNDISKDSESGSSNYLLMQNQQQQASQHQSRE